MEDPWLVHPPTKDWKSAHTPGVIQSAFNRFVLDLHCKKTSSTLLQLFVSGQFHFPATTAFQFRVSQYQGTDLAEN